MAWFSPGSGIWNISGSSPAAAPARANDAALRPLPRRDPQGHKGTFGTVSVVGGCCTGGARMIGAPVLAARAALRSGAGLVRLVMPGPIVDAAIQMLPSATGVSLAVRADGEPVPHSAAEAIDLQTGNISYPDPTGRGACDAMVVGPGLGRGHGPESLVLRALGQDLVPVVVDADALNVMSEIEDLGKDFRARAILTPHPGEYVRLAAKLRIVADPIREKGRANAAEQLAQRLGCLVVLKGAGTVVTDGQRTWTCQRGNSALATAGTGDVLAGLIAGLIAQFARRGGSGEDLASLNLFEAACLGVQAHAIAAERWCERTGAQAGVLASEIADEIPAALSELAEAE